MAIVRMILGGRYSSVLMVVFLSLSYLSSLIFLLQNLVVAILNSAYEDALQDSGDSYWAKKQYNLIVNTLLKKKAGNYNFYDRALESVRKDNAHPKQKSLLHFLYVCSFHFLAVVLALSARSYLLSQLSHCVCSRLNCSAHPTRMDQSSDYNRRSSSQLRTSILIMTMAMMMMMIRKWT